LFRKQKKPNYGGPFLKKGLPGGALSPSVTPLVIDLTSIEHFWLMQILGTFYQNETNLLTIRYKFRFDKIFAKTVH